MNRFGMAVSIFSVVLLGPMASSTVAATSFTTDAYAQAREVLDAALEASGGADRINALKSVSWEQKGTLYARNQSPRNEKPFAANTQESRSILDLENGWLVSENTNRFPTFVFSNRTIIKGDEKYAVNLVNRTFQPNENLEAVNFGFMHRLFPPLMLRKALQQATSLRRLGSTDLAGRPHEVLTFAWDNGQAVTLFIDAKSHLLTKYELLFPDALTGDAAAEIWFQDYRELDGLQVPSGFTWYLAGDLIGELEYDSVKIDQPVDEMVYAVPDGYTETDPPPTDLPKVTELAPDVFIVEGLANGGYNGLFVAFDDYIVVMDAPISSAVSSQAIAQIKETVPDKPIRYLVLSHHHEDHSGGMRAFVAEGATIVTTDANRAFFEQMTSGTRSLAADALSREPQKPNFEFVAGKRIFEDKAHRIEIIDIGPNPHAEELFVAYLPKEKILFEADLLTVPRSGPILPANEATIHFAKAIDELDLEVDTLVGVHGTVGSVSDLERALAAGEAQ
jgi:glyoxylase-like metal-dependent hydrolase (beta-lactamase superfamily II)